MKIAIHAGHNPDGMVACGAVGILKESTCARRVMAELAEYLANAGIDVVDVTVNNGKNQQGILNTLVADIKKEAPDLSLSIHLNAYTATSANGCEIYTKDETLIPLGEKIMDNIAAATGIKKRRVITTSNFAVIMPKKVGCDAMIVECCYVTSPTDAEKFNAPKIAKAIADAVCDEYGIASVGTEPENVVKYHVQSEPFTSEKNATKLAEQLHAEGYNAWVVKE